MQERVFQAALAGLLHDIGKYLGRASPQYQSINPPNNPKTPGQHHAEAGRRFVDDYVPPQFSQIRDVVGSHPQPELLAGQAKSGYELASLVRLADTLAAGASGGNGSTTAPPPALVPVLAQVELLESPRPGKWQYRPSVLALDRESIFPSEAAEGEAGAYQTLWTEHFQAELTRWKTSGDWARQSPEAYFTTLMALLQRHLAFVPASSPWPGDEDDSVWPDVSLFNHLKVTAAIAACLADSFNPDEIKAAALTPTQPVARLVRGDLSGIQGFIYRITEPEMDAGYEHVAKRLRGRSFYLALLGDVVADWLVRRLELSAANIMFVGGGQFDLLIPLKKQAALQDCMRDLEEWLLEKFYGELGLQVASVELSAADFGDIRAAYKQLSRSMDAEKLRKWAGYLPETTFMIPDDALYHRCRVCHLTPLGNPGTCPMCRDHARIGQRLPHTTHLAFAYEQMQWPGGCVTLAFEQFGVTVGLLTDGEVDPFVQAARGPARLSRLNPETAFIRAAQPNLAQSFSFLANAAPVATANLRQPNMQPIDRDDVLHFDAVAELSQGAKRIGILKADVDRLGLLFREGLLAENGLLRPTLGRVMTLSSALDLFFAGWLNHICAEIFREWQARQQNLAEEKRHPWYDKVDGLFYVMYSGGDDLFIVGPWDETLQLAERLQADFARYACHNPNVTLSAGFVQVKPRYPVQRFAGLVDEAEGRAKQAGRNRVTVFGQVVPWTGANFNFVELLAFSQKLQRLLETPDAEQRIPRTLLHDLGRLYRSHRQKGGGKLKPMWTPRIFYTMARRLSRETMEDIRYDLMKAMSNHIILVPVSYASLITRKE